MDYKTVFINLCLELQQNWSWIKGLGKNPFTHSIPFTHSLTAVPFVRGHRSVFPRTLRNTGVYTRHPTCVYTASEAKGLIHVHVHTHVITFHPIKTFLGIYEYYLIWISKCDEHSSINNYMYNPPPPKQKQHAVFTIFGQHFD